MKRPPISRNRLINILGHPRVGVALAIVVLAWLLVDIQWRNGNVSIGWRASDPRPPETSSNEPRSDQALTATLPEPDRAAQLPPSPLNELLKPDLTPQQQVGIVGQMLLDYWTSVRSLPAGTWDEVYAALAGENKRSLALIPRDHPALGPSGFQSTETSPSIRMHIISSRDGVFQLIYSGADAEHYTDDDLICNFPPDLAINASL